MLLLNRLRNKDMRNIAVYGLTTGSSAVLTLVLTRVLWRALSADDFGVWMLVDPMLLPVASLVMLGVEHGVVKQLRVDHQPLRVVTGTLLTSTLPTSLLCLVATGLIARVGFHLPWTGALILTMAGEALMLMLQSAFRAAGSVYLFAALLLSRNLVYLAVLLLAEFRSGDARLAIGFVFLTRGCCVIAVGLAGVAALRPVPRLDWSRYCDALRYGFPLLLTTFIYALTDMTDRWFLAECTGVVAVGVYALHLKIAAILSQAIVIPFGLWFPPERFKRLEAPDGGRRFFIGTAVVLTLICGYVSGAVWLARDVVLSLIAPGVMASPFVLACCLGSVTCLALSQALNVGLLMPGHTGKNAICNAYTVAATGLAALIFVPAFGMQGAATARLAGGVVMLVTTAWWSNRVFAIAFPLAAMMIYAAGCVLAAVGIDAISADRGFVGVVLALVGWTLLHGIAAACFWRRIRDNESPAVAAPEISTV